MPVRKLSLGKKQELFMFLLPRLLDKAHSMGFQVRGGELQRMESQAIYNSLHCRECKQSKKFHPNDHKFRAIGIKRSLHRSCIAIDIKLIREGKYLKFSSQYKPLGIYWENLDPLCAWGGRFRNPDGGHFSIAHGGRR